MANENIRVGADMTSFDQSMEQSAKKAEQSFYDIVNSVKKSSSNVKKVRALNTRSWPSVPVS